MSNTPPDWITPQAQTQTAEHTWHQLRRIVRHYVNLANSLNLGQPENKWQTQVDKGRKTIMVATVRAGKYVPSQWPGFKLRSDRITGKYPHSGDRFDAYPVVNPNTLQAEVEIDGE